MINIRAILGILEVVMFQQYSVLELLQLEKSDWIVERKM